MTEENNGILTVDQAWSLFRDGILGTKEFRSWLAKVDPNFAAVRDADIDNEIDALARERRQARNVEENQEAV